MIFTENRGLVARVNTIQPSLNKMLNYSRETALHGALVLAKSKRLELGDNILQTL